MSKERTRKTEYALYHVGEDDKINEESMRMASGETHHDLMTTIINRPNILIPEDEIDNFMVQKEVITRDKLPLRDVL